MDPCVPLAGRFDGYDPAFLAAIDKAMSVLPKERLQSVRQWLSAISENDGGKARRLPTPEPTRSVTPMTRVTRVEAEAARKKIGPVVLIGAVAALSLVVVGVYLAMPGSNTAKVARLTAEVAAANALPVETAEAAPETALPAPVETAIEEPAVEVQPTASPAAGERVARSDGSALTSKWTVELPFSKADGAPTTVGGITGEVPDWLVPGLQIVAVNGIKINSIDEIPALLQQNIGPGESSVIAANLSTVAETGATPLDQNIDLPVVHSIFLRSGAEFAVHWNAGAWQTEVVALPFDFDGVMQVGDIVIGHVSSGTRLDSPNALKDLLEAAIISGDINTSLAVEHDGQMWVVTFPLPT
jgi:hypothetical protein